MSNMRNKGKSNSGVKEVDSIVVEKVIDQRVNQETGNVEYFVKWKNRSEEERTWESEQSLDCSELTEFKAECAKRRADAASASALASTSQENIIGFARGLEPEKIMGATNASGSLCFLMKWWNSSICDLVPAEEANVNCPQIVIQFYEDRTVFDRSEKKNEDKSKPPK